MIEACHVDGNPYPASSISNLLPGLYQHCKEHDANYPRLINRKDPAFQDLNGMLQVRYQSLRDSGVGAVLDIINGAVVKHAVVVSSEEEEDTL